MAEQRALILQTGRITQMPAGDTLAGMIGTGQSGQFASNTQLTQTGATLLSLINASSAGVSSLNAGSGALTLQGAGSVTVTTVGQVITVSGSSTAGGGGDVTSGQLTSTGVQLFNLITGLSGQAVGAYATIPNLTNTGTTLGAKIDSLSGWAASAANLAATGSNLYGFVTGLSGQAASTYATQVALTASGQQLSAVKVTGSNVINQPNFSGIGGTQVIRSGDFVLISGGAGGAGDVTSAQLTSTGVQLFSLITGLSGQAVDAYATKTQLTNTGVLLGGRTDTLTTNLALTGSNLYGVVTGLSGQSVTDYAAKSNLALTGSNLFALVTGLSGQAVSAYATITNLAATGSELRTQLTGLSGQAVSTYATIANLASTGQQVWDAQRNNALNISGALAATGGLLSAVKVSGSSIVNTVDISGVGGTRVIRSGNSIVLVSGGSDAVATNLTTTGATLFALISASSAGVGSINGASGALTVQGAGNVSVTTAGQTITVSGDVYAQSGFNAATYATLALVTGLSGQSVTDYATKTNLTLTGQTLGSNLATTGSNLYQLVTGLSGQAVSTYATLANVTLTGQTLGAKIDSLSGWAASAANLALTGQQAVTLANNNGVNLSGQLTATGAALGARINGSALNGLLYLYGTGVRAPARYIGDANYTLVSGDYMVVATGAVPNVTGILPNPAVFSGNIFTLINARTATFPLSGVIGPDTNPSIQPYDSLQIYALDGGWQYIGRTGYSAYATNTALTATGVTLGSRVDTLTTNLTLTGQTLGAKVDSLSGWAASAVNLTITGSNLYVLLTGLSGQSVTDYATKVALTSTGQQAITLANNNGINLSGQLTATGVALGSRIDTVTSNLALTGSNLYVLVTGLSGQSVTDYATKSNLALTGQSLWTNLATSGSNLYQLVTGLSGQGVSDYATKAQLTSTGVDLGSRLYTTGANLFALVTGLSGQAVSAYATISNLTATGATLWQRDIDISGALQTQIAGSGTQVSVTGSSTMAAANFTGIGTSFIDRPNANTVRISGFFAPLMYACSDETTAITAATGKLSFRMPFAMRFTGVRVDMNAPPSGSSFILDLNQSGSTVFSTRPSIDSMETSTLTAAAPAIISGGFLADGAPMTVDFDQVGAVSPGCGVKLSLYGYPV